MLDELERAHIERQARQLVEGQRWESAATLVIRAYGPEVMGFAHRMLRDDGAADDAFAVFGEQVWRALPTFEWRSSLRTYVYSIARLSIARVRRVRAQRRARELRLDTGFDAIAAEVRERTATLQRTGGQMALAAFRAALDPDEEELLVLRVDRRMSFREIASIVEPEADPTRTSATLRKRFERLKVKLRRIAETEGLLADR